MTDVTRPADGSIVVNIDPSEIPSRTHERTPKRKYDTPAFFGSLHRDMVDNVGSNLAQQNAWLMNEMWRTGAETLQEWQFTLFEGNTRTPDGRSIPDLLDQAIEFQTRVLYQVGTFQATCLDIPEEYIPARDELDDTLTPDLAVDMVWDKCVWEPFWAYLGERKAAEVLSERYDTDFVATDAEIEAETGVENADSKGIDLYLTDEEKRVQVKMGGGGKPPGAYDWLVRVYADKGKLVITEK